MIVVLENGHGEDTAGKRSPVWSDGSQLFEWQFNRDMVSRIDAMLCFKGVQTFILVPEDIDISLEERAVRANETRLKSILLSVHANAGGGTGFEAFTVKGKTKADDLAEYIYNSISWTLPTHKLRVGGRKDYKAKEKDFYIIKKVWMPAVLIECGFMDNEKDCRLLMSETWKDLMAGAITEGIINYIKGV